MDGIIYSALFGNIIFLCELVIAHDVTYAFGSQTYVPGYSSASTRPSFFVCNVLAVTHTAPDALFLFN
jgi:hypothetical protein